ncbi:threonylcarbamoyl-AMP synthase [Spiribacter sp. 2438]|uniref:L-threonylcarbamoyladenylate synthase n=1 Tax=Spiribacter sp. 2438 TaxID=2666185 RepID=UPI0012AF3A84|nr:L-threonylcarbamoyladenylate synthase [Spiribacter sp. 2438]QGM21385.1 threonylcarbamoyl-AMP synthase [Spiribacter sp. 2438]
MSQYFEVHPETPQPRLVRRAVEIIRAGGLVAYPSGTTYALGCGLGEKAAVERIRALRQLDERHHFTLACRDLSDIGSYTRMDNTAFRLLKAHTPGPYTFVLRATAEVPRRLQHSRRRTVGIRVPDHPVARAILTELGEPLTTSTLLLPDEDYPMTDPADIRDRIGRQLDAVIDAGPGGLEPSTVVDLSGEAPQVLRHGAGDADVFES